MATSKKDAVLLTLLAIGVMALLFGLSMGGEYVRARVWRAAGISYPPPEVR
jgi:hypothetical protein